MDIETLGNLLKKAFRKECNLVDNSPLFYQLEFSDPFTINEFEEWAHACKKFLSQYGLKTGSTSMRYSKTFHKYSALQLYKLPLEKFLETLATLNKDLKLHDAILENDTKKAISVLLNNGANVNSSDIVGETPLHRAVKKGNDEIIHLLLEKGALINSVNNKGETSLHMIAKTDYVDTLEKLLATSGIDIHIKDNLGNSCLCPMAFLGKQAMLDKLFQAGINIEAVNSYGETPLFSAIYGVNLSAVKFFLERGAYVNHQSSNGMTPLSLLIFLAVNFENPASVFPLLTTLLNFGADIMIPTSAKESALQIADKANNMDIGKLLIDTLLTIDPMLTKPHFHMDGLSHYWDILIQKKYHEALQKSSESEMFIHNANNMISFFSKTGFYEVNGDKRVVDNPMVVSYLNQ